MTPTTNRNEEGMRATRNTRVDLATLLTPNVDGSWEPVPEITEPWELLELHGMLLEAAPLGRHFVDAARLVAVLINAAGDCVTDKAGALVPSVVTRLFDGLRAEPTSLEERVTRFDCADGWLTHLQLVNKADRADATPQATTAGETVPVDYVVPDIPAYDQADEITGDLIPDDVVASLREPRPTRRRWRCNGLVPPTTAGRG
jgi:hypothetical protein